MGHPYTGECELHVTGDTIIVAEILDSQFDKNDGSYHYKLQAVMTDGNNAASVIIKDVHQSIITFKE